MMPFSHAPAATLMTALFIATSAFAQSHDFSGEYVMKGRGDGTNDRDYSGSCSVKKQGKGYNVSCINTDTNHTYVGRGLSTGNTLAIMIGDRLVGNHGQVYEGEYLAIYTREKDGTLVGRWIDATRGSEGNETLTPKK